MIMLRNLRWGDYPELSSWAQCNRGVLIRGKKEGQSHRNRYDKGNSGQSDMAPWAKECRKSLEAAMARNGFSSTLSRGTSPSKALILSS